MAVAVVQVVGTGALEGTGGPDTQVQVSVPSIAAGSRLLAFHTRDVTNNATVTITGGGGTWVNIGYAPSPSGTGDANGEEVGAWYNDSPSTGTQTVNFNFSGSGEQVTGGVVVELSGAATGSNWLANHQQQTAPGTGTDAVGAAATVTPSVATGRLIGCGFDSNTNGAPNTGTANSPTSHGTFWSWVFSGGVLSARIQSQANAGTSAIASTFTCVDGTRGAEDHISWTVWVPEPSAVVVQPPPDTSAMRGLSSRISVAAISSISGTREILALAAPTAGKQFYPSQPDLGRRLGVQDRANGSSSTPIISTSTTAVGTSWYAQETTRPQARLSGMDRGSGAPVSGIATALSALTWAVPSPVRIRTPSAADGGGGAIAPLNPPYWFPEGPDRGILLRKLFEAPGTVIRPISTQVTWTPPPEVSWRAKPRPQVPDGSGFGERPLYLANLSWLNHEQAPRLRRLVPPEPAALDFALLRALDVSWALQAWHQTQRRPFSVEPPAIDFSRLQGSDLSWALAAAHLAQRRALSADAHAVSFALKGAADLSWMVATDALARRRPVIGDGAAQPLTAASTTPTDLSWALESVFFPRRAARHGDAAGALMPVFQPQAPAWLPQPADVVVRRARPEDLGSAQALLALVQARDLSWAVDAAMLRRGRGPLHEGAFTPQATTVTLSSWGWIPEVPGRPGLRVINSTPVSALVPPIIVTAFAQGWLPSQPERPAARSLIPVLATVPTLPERLTAPWGWLPSDPDRALRRAPGAQDPSQTPPAPAGLSAWGWYLYTEHLRRRGPVVGGEEARALGPLPGATPDWLFGTADARTALRRPQFQDPAQGPAPAAILQVSLEWSAGQPQVVVRRAPRAADAGYPARVELGFPPLSEAPAIGPRKRAASEAPAPVLPPLSSATLWVPSYEAGRPTWRLGSQADPISTLAPLVPTTLLNWMPTYPEWRVRRYYVESQLIVPPGPVIVINFVVAPQMAAVKHPGAPTMALISALNSTQQANFYLKRGDLLPAIRAELTTIRGPLNLNGSTVVFRMRATDTTGVPQTEALATIIDAAKGVVQYDWMPGDTDATGYFDIEWAVTFPSGQTMTMPNNGVLRVLISDILA